MDIQQWMMTKLAEEASEVAQAASRVCLFSKDSINPKTGNTSLADLMGELNDLGACIAFYERAADLHLVVEQLRATEGGTSSIAKIARVALKAAEQGQLELTNSERIELEGLI